MAEVLVLQHVEPETPGIIGDLLLDRGLSMSIIRCAEGDPVPHKLSDTAGLLVMGGPMGVYEADCFPFLLEEMRLIETTIREGKPVLGICLGSQLLAAVLGAQVYKNTHKEIGWHEVTLKKQASSDGLWQGVQSRFYAFHWHGDVFDLPDGAVSLAESDKTIHQAFRYGANVYGFLFHMEVTPSIIQGMSNLFVKELVAEGMTEAEIMKPLDRFLPELTEVGHLVFGRWVDLVCNIHAVSE